MTVDELREALKDVPGDRVVVVSSDQEGNSYRLAGVSPDEFFDIDDMQAYAEEDAEEYDITDRAVVIW